MMTLMDRMKIDPPAATEIILDFLQQKVREGQQSGICLGVSGGVDSAIVCTLAVRAMRDPSQVHGWHLFDKDSMPKTRKNARSLAQQLGIHYQEIDLTPKLREQGIYEPTAVRFLGMSARLNRLIFSSLHKIRRLMGYGSWIGAGGGPWGESDRFAALRSRIKSHISVKPVYSGFQARHILRREILEAYASKNNLLLVGAANRTEAFMGWYIPDGVDDLPIQPILDLYKNQVFQLAKFLGVSTEIIEIKPSNDMVKGVGDEDITGLTYDTMDKVAYVVENDLDKGIAFSDGVTPKDFKIVMQWNRRAVKYRQRHEKPSLV